MGSRAATAALLVDRYFVERYFGCAHSDVHLEHTPACGSELAKARMMAANPEYAGTAGSHMRSSALPLSALLVLEPIVWAPVRREADPWPFVANTGNCLTAWTTDDFAGPMVETDTGCHPRTPKRESSHMATGESGMILSRLAIPWSGARVV